MFGSPGFLFVAKIFVFVNICFYLSIFFVKYVILKLYTIFQLHYDCENKSEGICTTLLQFQQWYFFVSHEGC